MKWNPEDEIEFIVRKLNHELTTAEERQFQCWLAEDQAHRSLFQEIVKALKDKRPEVIQVTTPVSSVLCIGELEIHHEHRRVLMAGREVQLNHGEYATLYCMASAPGQVFSKAQLYAAAWGEEYLYGTTSVENIIWRPRQKLEQDPRHPFYIKTVVRNGYKIDGSTK